MFAKLVVCWVALAVLGQHEAFAKESTQRRQMLDADAEDASFGDRAALDAAINISKKKQHRIDKLAGRPPPFDLEYHKGLEDAYHKVDGKHHIPSATGLNLDAGEFGESFIPKPVKESEVYSAALSSATKPMSKHNLKKVKEIAGNPEHGAFLKNLEEAYHKVDPEHHIPEGVATTENGYGMAQPKRTPEALYVITNDTSYTKVYQILLGGFIALVVLSVVRVRLLRATGDEKMLRYSDSNDYASADLNDDMDQYDNVKGDDSLSSSYLLAGGGRPTPALDGGSGYGAVI